MDFNALETFVKVYESGSVAKAAREEYITRQAMSKVVRQLERELGELFVREARGLRPTPLADAIYPHACAALKEQQAISAEAALFSAGRAGSLRLSVEANAALTLPRGLSASYSQKRPGVKLEVLSLPAVQALESLYSCRVDAAICSPTDRTGYAFDPIMVSTLSIVFPTSAIPGSLIVSQSSQGGFYVADLEALSNQTIFGVAPTNHVERQLVPYLKSHGIQAQISYEFADTALATFEMEGGSGGVIVEVGGAEAHFGTDAYVHIPLRGEGAPSWQVGAIYRPDDPNAALIRDFCSFAREKTRDIQTASA